MFREEALQAHRARGTGEILLAQGVSSAALTLLFCVIAAAIVAFLFCASVTRKETVPGVITPSKGLIRVVPMQTGVIAKRQVQDGQFVHAGDVLFVLSSDRSSTTRGDTALAVSDLIEARRRSLALDQGQQRLQNEERLQTARKRAQDLLTEQDRIDKQIQLQGRRLAIAQEVLARYQDLQRSNFVSAAQVEDHQADVIDQQQRLADLQRAKAGAARDLLSAQGDIKEIELQMQRDDEAAQRGQSELAQNLTENEAQREVTVRAPESGTVATTTADVGQTVLPNQLLATIVPADSTLEAELYVPSRSIGFVKSGMPVLLRYEAFPYQKFGQFKGVVREVSKASVRPEELSTSLLPAGSGGEPIYKLRATLDEQAVQAYGKETPLRAGMTLEASVVIERRHLYEWVLDPLYSITGRL
jgi:membrane fusion protein